MGEMGGLAGIPPNRSLARSAGPTEAWAIKRMNLDDSKLSSDKTNPKSEDLGHPGKDRTSEY